MTSDKGQLFATILHLKVFGQPRECRCSSIIPQKSLEIGGGPFGPLCRFTPMVSGGPCGEKW
ncbi:hypothetical protein [[Phormidium] sp. ETS-05]|uniref:hypothetical protein n=1 Tax=[Phormidium] sp. ETS-05 TaxID=222819 RepID=UPI001E47FED1|nr:hypothetical protein [[Phormidium] sp. ETS-05]